MPRVSCNAVEGWRHHYVDDIMIVSDDTNRVMNQIQENLKFKHNTWHDPDIYLGAKIDKKLHDGKYVYTMTSRGYITAAMKDVENKLTKERKTLQTKAITPLSHNYRPELDNSAGIINLFVLQNLRLPSV